ncbi:hypothetical protein LTR37_006715 [Vermiconidia calcicola]|uniref:Uncharacterized protein n=1 Tax=Vermiconidia calcicola TaxID=1690605 RepID=A0ACC3NFN2_9PEZI|nr:hypothetical protein LTR37_006715 [Vermiconidia calcicola]
MSTVTERCQVAKSRLATNATKESDSNEYNEDRQQLVTDDQKRSWDWPAKSSASLAEQRARKIIFKIREHERSDPELFGNLPGENVPDARSRDMGGRFLVNLPKIRLSKIYAIARRIPKGCHQHLHFNSEVSPEELFPYARNASMGGTMFIRSTRPLLNLDDYEETEIVFNVLPESTTNANIFSDKYNPEWKNTTNSPWMLWKDFRQQFFGRVPREAQTEGLEPAESWARHKMVITIDHTYNQNQTHNGAWACFNQGTRAFKGLLGYEGIYRWYIGHAIDRMIGDKVMYAELRPMLMDKTMPSDDGLRQLGHKEQMSIICEEITKKKEELKRNDQLDQFPFGLKIIYCAPRSIPRQRMHTELEDCLKLKLQFPDLVCGFDLVGAEDRPNNIGFYADLLTAFTKTCDELNISIPFFFHAGETLLDTGGSHHPENSNLYDALLLKAKRIGHGYALLKHPELVEKYKQQNICLELCPISNELLHLCGNAREHPYPQLLAAGLHCTLNADNPSLFRGNATFSSSLSDEFYQVIVGDPRMTVHGWKQLAQWSIEHSCLGADDMEKAKEIHARDWEEFCEWVVSEYGEHAASLPELP